MDPSDRFGCPFWLVFTSIVSASAAERYLDSPAPFDEIYLMLLSNGMEAIGLASIDRWRSILRRAPRRGAFVGVDEEEFPFDLASFPRYDRALQQQVRARVMPPDPLTINEFGQFFATFGARYRVQWTNES